MERALNKFLRMFIFIVALVYFMFFSIGNVKAPAITMGIKTYETQVPPTNENNNREENIVVYPIQQYNQVADSGSRELPIIEEIEKENPVNPYIFTLDNNDVDFSIGYLEIQFDEGLLAGKSAKFNVVSPDNLGPFKTTRDALGLDSKTGVIRKDNYGNLLLGLHSGYLLASGRPLEAEFLRYSLEEWGRDTKYVENKLSEIIGSSGTITLNEYVFQIEVIGAIRLQHEESGEINLNPEMVLDIVTKTVDDQYIALGDIRPFEKAKSEHRLMINFCGWGPNKQTTYYRYIILIDIKEEVPTN